MSRDANHATIVRAFKRTVGEHGVVELHNIGDGCPDLLIGYAGTERLVETKVPAVRSGPRRAKSRCRDCGRTYSSHFKQRRSIAECPMFRPEWVTKERGGKLEPKQKTFHAKWPGHRPIVVLTEEDVEKVLDLMRAERPYKRGFE